VADATFDAGAVARSAFAGASGAGFVATGELDLLVGQRGERVFGRTWHEAAVEDDFAQPDAGAVKLTGGLGQ